MSNSSNNGIHIACLMMFAMTVICIVVFGIGGAFGDLYNFIADKFNGTTEYNQIKIDTILYNKAKELNITITNEDVEQPDIILWSTEDALNKLEQSDKLTISFVEELCSFSVLYNIHIDKDIYQYKDTYNKDCFSNISNKDIKDILENGNVITQINPEMVTGKIIAISVVVSIIIGAIILLIVLMYCAYKTM